MIQKKINFIGFWKSFKPEKNIFYKILSEKFDIVISDNPDYIFVAPNGRSYEYLKYDCIRIMYTGEEIVPDFNLFDYAIGFDDIVFGDRYCRYPFAFYREDGAWSYQNDLNEETATSILINKDLFCNLIYWEDSIGNFRTKLFNRLNDYKKVTAAGRLMNNVGTKGCSYAQKFDYLRRSKFTIAVEGCSQSGVVTEKITHPFEMHSIPIYYGNTDICKDFNKYSFINCHDYSDIDEIAEKVIEIDKNDHLYIQMLLENPTITADYATKMYEQLENFLISIFSQDIDEGRRRVDSLISRLYNRNLKYISHTPEILLSAYNKFEKRGKK